MVSMRNKKIYSSFTIKYSLIARILDMPQKSVVCESYIVELQWLEQAWDHENKFQLRVALAIQGQFLYEVTPRDPETSSSQAGSMIHQGSSH